MTGSTDLTIYTKLMRWGFLPIVCPLKWEIPYSQVFTFFFIHMNVSGFFTISILFFFVSVLYAIELKGIYFHGAIIANFNACD
jgi:hypothetical protein